jgi:hypothetical protein
VATPDGFVVTVTGLGLPLYVWVRELSTIEILAAAWFTTNETVLETVLYDPLFAGVKVVVRFLGTSIKYYTRPRVI